MTNSLQINETTEDVDHFSNVDAEETVKNIQWFIDASKYFLRATSKLKTAYRSLKHDDCVKSVQMILRTDHFDEKIIQQVIEVMVLGKMLEDPSGERNSVVENFIEMWAEIETIIGSMKDLDLDTPEDSDKSKTQAPGEVILDYLGNRVEPAKGSTVIALRLYDDYCTWCENNRFYPVGLPVFSKEIKSYDIQTVKIGGKIRYSEIRIKGS